jgi:pilus assembly protein Flp/PilA
MHAGTDSVKRDPLAIDTIMTETIRQSILDFLAEEDGPTAVEYAIVLAMIAGACIASVNFMAAQTIQSFESSQTAIAAAN